MLAELWNPITGPVTTDLIVSWLVFLPLALIGSAIGWAYKKLRKKD